jgi:hypothetical protein
MAGTKKALLRPLCRSNGGERLSIQGRRTTASAAPAGGSVNFRFRFVPATPRLSQCRQHLRGVGLGLEAA